jgi:hypothetical protein
MTFRPSVLPDRDNDIISTFTRSFERTRNLVRKEQADVRERKRFEQESLLRGQEIEDREFDAAVRSGGAGTFDPGRRGDRTPDTIEGALGRQTPRAPVGAGGLFPGAGADAADPDARTPAGPPRLLPGRGGLEDVPGLFSGVPARPGADAPEVGVGGVRVRTEPDGGGPTREQITTPGFLPEPDLPEDAVALPGGSGRFFSETLRRMREREEGAADIASESEALEGTAAGVRAIADERRRRETFEALTPAELTQKEGAVDAFRRRFAEEMAEIPDEPGNLIEAFEFGTMLARQEELNQRNEGLGSVAGRQRENRIQTIIDQQLKAIGRENFPPGPEGRAMASRFRANAERQVDAEASGEPGADVTTDEIILAADRAELSDEQLQSIEAEADSILADVTATTRSLSGIQGDMEFISSGQRRVLEPLLLERVIALWDDPQDPWSDPGNRPGSGIAVGGFGRGAGPAKFKEADSPQEIVDIIMGRDASR